MNTRRIVRLAAAVLVVPIAALIGSGVASADPPSPGDYCSKLHATTTDAAGTTMWCNPMMTGSHQLVWQYGGPA
jgi:hypothetical protein